MEKIYKMELSPPNSNKNLSKHSKESNKKFSKPDSNSKTSSRTVCSTGNNFMTTRVFHMWILLQISNQNMKIVLYQRRKFKLGSAVKRLDTNALDSFQKWAILFWLEILKEKFTYSTSLKIEHVRTLTSAIQRQWEIFSLQMMESISWVRPLMDKFITGTLRKEKVHIFDN